MRILLYTAGSNAGSWLEALRRAFPGVPIDGWPSSSASEADYVLVWKPPVELLRALGRVKAIFNLGAGVDSVPDLSALPPDANLVRLEDAGMAEQMAEYVCHAVLRRYREFDAYAEQQQSAEWRPRPRLSKGEFIVGILGLGVLGTAVASALAPFGFPLRAWSRTPKLSAGVVTSSGFSQLDDFLAGTRVLVCLLPLTSQTQRLLDRPRLLRLPRGAYLVNVSRGAIVVDDELLALLDDDHLAGATLDVFQDEPLPPEHRFWHHPRVTLTPHVSAVTLVDESVAQIAAKIRCLEAGLPITGVVGREHGY
ncbi:MAG TPA: glyoxylate/hydroxypyruvate reductase A [Casimicrobiaceae bacterium]|nr:glyoxylate/hydroxypyruvate reductase A [Casimicrobiaceae bacterium]